jgi:SAM-dependent methyltransferase
LGGKVNGIQPSQMAAERGEPSYIWRAGQQRRLERILDAAGERIQGRLLENGCGIGLYLEHLIPLGCEVFGLEYDFKRALEARSRTGNILGAAGEDLPFPESLFDLILSNEVIEHVVDDQKAVREMIRTLVPGGRMILFCPNRWYPFETHGIYWQGKYHFGNKALVNYLPRGLRDRLAPHVRVYTRRDLEILFLGLPVKFIHRKVIFGGYDNIISRFPGLGRLIRAILYWLEKTPLQILGLSHYWVIEKNEGKPS